MVDKHGQDKSVTQIKNKLRNLKDSYKQSKENNNNNKKKTGASPRYSAFYHDFDEVLWTRDVVNLQYMTQVGAKYIVLDPTKHSYDCRMVHTPGMWYPLNT